MPIAKGQPVTQTHDYIRHGPTTLFAALNVLDGTMLDQCAARHRHLEIICFLNAVEAAVPVGKVAHVILDNQAVPDDEHPDNQFWVDRRASNRAVERLQMHAVADGGGAVATSSFGRRSQKYKKVIHKWTLQAMINYATLEGWMQRILAGGALQVFRRLPTAVLVVPCQAQSKGH